MGPQKAKRRRTERTLAPKGKGFEARERRHPRVLKYENIEIEDWGKKFGEGGRPHNQEHKTKGREKGGSRKIQEKKTWGFITNISHGKKLGDKILD